MDVLLTGSYGRVGTAIIDHLHDREEYEFTYLNRSDRPDDHPYGEFETVVADVSNLSDIRPAFEGKDAVVHLAGAPEPDYPWSEVLENNIIGMYNVLEATKDAEVEKFVFGSTNHVVGMYEIEHEPEIYEPDFDLKVDHTAPHRPDSYYGTSKCFDEDIGRYYIENYDYPTQFYALRIGSVRWPEYDHPYGDAERGVDEGDWDRSSEDYHRMVRRMKALWQSRRDLAQMVDRSLQDDSVEFDIFYGVSDNDGRWFDISHARDVIGYTPEDNGAKWDSPPE